MELQYIKARILRKKDTLPNKPSELLFLAIKDMQKLKKNKDFRFNMSVWHRDNRKDDDCLFKACFVCMAGAVMANTLKAPRYKETKPESYKDRKIENKLQAIDSLRGLNIKSALLHLLGDDYFYKIDELSVKHKIPALHKKTIRMLRSYKMKKGIYNNGEAVSSQAQDHLDFYKKYAALLEKAGL